MTLRPPTIVKVEEALGTRLGGYKSYAAKIEGVYLSELKKKRKLEKKILPIASCSTWIQLASLLQQGTMLPQ